MEEVICINCGEPIKFIEDEEGWKFWYHTNPKRYGSRRQLMACNLYATPTNENAKE